MTGSNLIKKVPPPVLAFAACGTLATCSLAALVPLVVLLDQGRRYANMPLVFRKVFSNINVLANLTCLGGLLLGSVGMGFVLALKDVNASEKKIPTAFLDDIRIFAYGLATTASLTALAVGIAVTTRIHYNRLTFSSSIAKLLASGGANLLGFGGMGSFCCWIFPTGVGLIRIINDKGTEYRARQVKVTVQTHNRLVGGALASIAVLSTLAIVAIYLANLGQRASSMPRLWGAVAEKGHRFALVGLHGAFSLATCGAIGMIAVEDTKAPDKTPLTKSTDVRQVGGIVGIAALIALTLSSVILYDRILKGKFTLLAPPYHPWIARSCHLGMLLAPSILSSLLVAIAAGDRRERYEAFVRRTTDSDSNKAKGSGYEGWGQPKPNGPPPRSSSSSDDFPNYQGTGFGNGGKGGSKPSDPPPKAKAPPPAPDSGAEKDIAKELFLAAAESLFEQMLIERDTVANVPGVLARMVNYGFDLKRVNAQGLTPVMEAAKRCQNPANCIELVDSFLLRGASPFNFPNEPNLLHIAVAASNCALLEDLLLRNRLSDEHKRALCAQRAGQEKLTPLQAAEKLPMGHKRDAIISALKPHSPTVLDQQETDELIDQILGIVDDPAATSERLEQVLEQHFITGKISCDLVYSKLRLPLLWLAIQRPTAAVEARDVDALPRSVEKPELKLTVNKGSLMAVKLALWLVDHGVDLGYRDPKSQANVIHWAVFNSNYPFLLGLQHRREQETDGQWFISDIQWRELLSQMWILNGKEYTPEQIPQLLADNPQFAGEVHPVLTRYRKETLKLLGPSKDS